MGVGPSGGALFGDDIEDLYIGMAGGGEAIARSWFAEVDRDLDVAPTARGFRRSEVSWTFISFKPALHRGGTRR